MFMLGEANFSQGQVVGWRKAGLQKIERRDHLSFARDVQGCS
jgi:hypothetical protein